MNRTALGLIAVAATVFSLSAHAQLKSVDHGAAAVDSNGLMWANTVGIDLGWSPTPITYTDTAQSWVAGLNASHYDGYDDWSLATGDGSFQANTTTNQLGELFYTDCGNSPGSFTTLRNPGENCKALSSLNDVINSVDFDKGPQIILITSASAYPALDDFEQQGYWAYEFNGGLSSYSSFQRVLTTDTVVNGFVGRGDAMAVRHVPEIDPASSASGLALLLGGLAMLRGRREKITA